MLVRLQIAIGLFNICFGPFFLIFLRYTHDAPLSETFGLWLSVVFASFFAGLGTIVVYKKLSLHTFGKVFITFLGAPWIILFIAAAIKGHFPYIEEGFQDQIIAYIVAGALSIVASVVVGMKIKPYDDFSMHFVFPSMFAFSFFLAFKPALGKS